MFVNNFGNRGGAFAGYANNPYGNYPWGQIPFHTIPFNTFPTWNPTWNQAGYGYGNYGINVIPTGAMIPNYVGYNPYTPFWGQTGVTNTFGATPFTFGMNNSPYCPSVNCI
jgi:hypothetical protein